MQCRDFQSVLKKIVLLMHLPKRLTHLKAIGLKTQTTLKLSKAASNIIFSFHQCLNHAHAGKQPTIENHRYYVTSPDYIMTSKGSLWTFVWLDKTCRQSFWLTVVLDTLSPVYPTLQCFHSSRCALWLAWPLTPGWAYAGSTGVVGERKQRPRLEMHGEKETHMQTVRASVTKKEKRERKKRKGST